MAYIIVRFHFCAYRLLTQQFGKLEFAEESTPPEQHCHLRTSAHTGVGIPIEFQAAYRHTYRSFTPFSTIKVIGFSKHTDILEFGALARSAIASPGGGAPRSESKS